MQRLRDRSEAAVSRPSLERLRLCLGTKERILQTLRLPGPHFCVRQARREGEREAGMPLRGCGRGPGSGFHWLLLPEHWRCFWHLANLTEAELVIGAPARTVLKWPFQDLYPKSCCWNAQPPSQNSKDQGASFKGPWHLLQRRWGH